MLKTPLELKFISVDECRIEDAVGETIVDNRHNDACRMMKEDMEVIVAKVNAWDALQNKLRICREHKIDYREHSIVGGIKPEPWLIDGCMQMWGFSVVKDGCNPMPGATWFQTVQDAKAGIDIWIAVGGPETVRKTMAGEPHDIMPGQEFWRRWSSFKRQNDKAREAHLAFWTEARD